MGAIRYACFELSGMRYLGECMLPAGQMDEPGTEHMFGDVVYVFTHADYESEIDNGVMYFKRAEIQPFLELD